MLANYVYLIIVTFMCLACGKSNTNDSSMNQDTDQSESLQIQIPTIGELMIKNPQKDSTNQYGAGDCGGRTIQFGNYRKTLAFDTLDCGECIKGKCYRSNPVDNRNRKLPTSGFKC